MEPKLVTEIIHSPTDRDLRRAAALLCAGGLVAFPTETVYGLGASALDEAAAAKIYKAKGRPSDNPLILHLANPSQASLYAEVSLCFEKLASLFMPGPLTVILPKKPLIPDTVTGGLQTVAIRVPVHPMAHQLLTYVAGPVAAPSANRSGRPSCTNVSHVIEDMNGRIDMILDGGDCDFGLESTILLPVDDHTVKLLRPGAITVEMLEQNGFSVVLDKAVTQKLGENEQPLAPGMKYRHYAPKAEVILLDGPRERVVAYMEQQADADTALLLTDEMKSEVSGCKPDVTVLSLGKEEDRLMQAHRLFTLLRTLDEHPEIRRVYAALPATDNIGLALYNRLVKASGYTVLRL